MVTRRHLLGRLHVHRQRGRGQHQLHRDPANKSPLLGVFVDPGTKAVGDYAKGTVTVTAPQPERVPAEQPVQRLHDLQGRPGRPQARWPQKTIGTGPWVLSEAVADDHYSYTQARRLRLGSGRPDRDRARIPDTVNVRIIANQTTAANLLLSGEVNMAR